MEVIGRGRDWTEIRANLIIKNTFFVNILYEVAFIMLLLYILLTNISLHKFIL